MDDPIAPPSQRSRRLILVSGAREVLFGWVAEALTRFPANDVLWVGDLAVDSLRAVPARAVVHRLGSECGLLIFDAFDGFDPDAFAAAVGTLRGGGDCVVLTPTPAEWPDWPDPYRARIASFPYRPEQLLPGFIERLIAVWRSDQRCSWHALRCATPLRCAGVPMAAVQLTEAQRDVIDQIERVAHGHARRPLLLSADRGRGKSTVLGCAAARLLGQGLARITVVAPHRRAVGTLFAHARSEGGLGAGAVLDLSIGRGELRFRLPQACLSAADDPGLLMIDEAASLSVAVLQRLLRRSNRLVFATTEHGYEGSGRGFRLRFEALLREAMPQFRRASLVEPVRWAPDDPLEALVNQGLLLDCEAPTPAQGRVRIERGSPAALCRDERLLRGIFGLLVGAHYQTRPSDLRRLLDDPALRLWVALDGQAPCGVLLGAVEGGFDDPMSRLILAGRRRPQGHLLPQSLAVHAGLDDALGQRTLRIMRIAVHRDVQRRGIGRRLFDAAAQWAGAEDLDGLGCAYGIDADLLGFWTSLGLRPVRLGLRVDPASASHSVMMLSGVSQRGCALAERAAERFRRDLPWSLGDQFVDLPAVIAAELLRGRDCTDLPVDAVDRVCLARIADGARDPATAGAVVWRWLVRSVADGGKGFEPLVARHLQRWPVARVCEAYGLGGAAALRELLRKRLPRAENASFQSG